MSQKESHIEVRNLTMAYGDFVVMRELNFTIDRGDVFIIMGGSGCGKSTLMKILIGLKSPAVGQVFYEGKSLWEIDPEDRQQIMQRFGILYQSGALWSSMTLAQNVGLPLELYTGLGPGDIRDVVSLKLSLVGLAGFEGFYPSEISGGMRKRAGLARAMALDPEVLFFDEPSAGLDPVSARRLDDLILELRESLGGNGCRGDSRVGQPVCHRQQLGLSRSGDAHHDRQRRSKAVAGEKPGSQSAQLSNQRRRITSEQGFSLLAISHVTQNKVCKHGQGSQQNTDRGLCRRGGNIIGGSHPGARWRPALSGPIAPGGLF